MTTPLQTIALGKLRGQWVLEGSLNEDNPASPHALTNPEDEVEMTRAEAQALKSWFQEQGLSVLPGPAFDDLEPTQFKIGKVGDSIVLDLSGDSFEAGRDVEFFPKLEGDVQKYVIMIHTDAFLNFQIQFWRERWFTRLDDNDGPAQGVQLMRPEP